MEIEYQEEFGYLFNDLVLVNTFWFKEKPIFRDYTIIYREYLLSKWITK